jgi:hypothetical protein
MKILQPILWMDRQIERSTGALVGGVLVDAGREPTTIFTWAKQIRAQTRAPARQKFFTIGDGSCVSACTFWKHDDDNRSSN